MTYKFYYFDWTGLGELSRLIFAVNDVKFEDVRIPFEGNFPLLSAEWKAKTIWGQVPLLEVDGKKIGQSGAINRYLARKFNMVGSTELESAKCDEFVDAIMDFLKEWQKMFFERDLAKQEEIKKNILDVVVPKYYSKFNEAIAENGGKGLVGNNLTWADVYLCQLGSYLEAFCFVEFIKDYPAVEAVSEKFFSKPQVKNWVANRPNIIFNMNVFNDMMANLMKKK